MMRVYPQLEIAMKLVLLPGLDGTGELFSDFIQALTGLDPLVIAYPADREMDYAGHEQHARERLPQDKPFVLLGESFSGPIAISIAASPPAQLRGIILCCSFAANPLPMFGPLSRLIARFPAMKIPSALFAPLLYGGHATPAVRRAHARAMSRVQAATLRARVAAVLAADYRSQLRKIEVPLLYLLATADRLIPRSALRSIEAIRPDVQVAEFDAPHFLLQTRAEQAALRVRSFLDQLE
jgi:pimeloyl-ACP methyl ester carboxylesterase